MKNHGLFEIFSNVVLGFVDTIPIFKKKYPGRKNGPNYSQISLVQDFVGPDAANGAHNALADVKALKALIEKTVLTEHDLRDKSKSVERLLYDK